MTSDHDHAPAGAASHGAREQVSAEEGLVLLLDDAEAQHVAANHQAVRRASRITDAIEHAAANPWVYTGFGRRAVDTAERSAVFEIAARLHLPESQVRGIAVVVRAARAQLPVLWASASGGFASFASVEVAAAAMVALLPPPHGDRLDAAADLAADAAVRDASAAAIAVFDEKVTEFAMHLSPSLFRARVRRLIEQLSAELGVEVAARRHAIAMTERRVIIEPVGDGMAWVSALVPLIKAVAFKRRLTSTAKHRQKTPGQLLTRDQLRADLFCEWLMGEGTATAAKIKVFVTVPLDVLAGERLPGHVGAGSVGLGGGRILKTQAELVGHGPIDPATARQVFFEAGAFHRIATDPISGIKLDMDRRTYRPTTVQRDWLILTHGTCARDGCTRLALDADIDHQTEWARGGKTNHANLAPLCPPDHASRHRSRMAFRRRPNGTVEVTSPTGFRTHEPPPF